MNNPLSLNLKSLPGPDDVTRLILPNGVTVLARSNFSSPSVVVSGYLVCGSVFDPPAKLGLAQFTAASLMRGTRLRSFHEIYDSLESVGAGMGFGSSVINTSFSGRCLVEDLPLLLGLMSECLRQPAFPQQQIERLRSQILTGLSIRAQDTSERASLRFDEILFPNHPYGLPEDGTPETIRAIQIEDLMEFHQRCYGPRNMVVAIVGGITREEAVEKVQAAFGDWTNPGQPTAPPLPPIHKPVKTQREHIALEGKSQTDLIVGTLGPRRISPDYQPASLGNSILGQFGMMGRIGDVVREQAGLAYYASANLNAWMEGGSWEVSAGVNPANLERATDLILKEIRRFIQEPVGADELLDSQSNYIGRLPLSIESNGGVVQKLINIERFQLGLDYYQRYPGLIMAQTPETVLEAARRYLDPDNMVIVSSGPEKVEAEAVA